MFTGIIREKGKIIKIKEEQHAHTFSIQTKDILKDKKIGDSISIDGICTTITRIHKNVFDFDAMPETLSLTTLNSLGIDSEVNLEPSLKLSESIDGHFVQGHTDATGEVISITKGKDKEQIEISFPSKLSYYLALKGSITINGVSLTISHLKAKSLKVDLIPLTLEKTNLGLLEVGDKVNIEIDVIARYLKSLLDSKEKETKYEFLKERGFI